MWAQVSHSTIALTDSAACLQNGYKSADWYSFLLQATPSRPRQMDTYFRLPIIDHQQLQVCASDQLHSQTHWYGMSLKQKKIKNKQRRKKSYATGRFNVLNIWQQLIADRLRLSQIRFSTVSHCMSTDHSNSEPNKVTNQCETVENINW